MDADRHVGVQKESLCVGRIPSLFSINEQAPIWREHPIDASLSYEGKILVNAEIPKNSVGDVAEVEHIGAAHSDIRLDRAKLREVILKQNHGRPVPHASEKVGA